MPIKFACPQCKNVMSVADNMAGKNGKCKCGNSITVPRPAASDPAASTSPAMAAMFDQLSESDFDRTSPFEKVYSATKSNNDAASLKRFESQDDTVKKVPKGQLSGLLVFIAVISFLQGLSSIALAVILVAAQNVVSQIEATVPILKLGMAAGIAFFSLWSIVLIASGVGLLMKKAWGWFLVAMVFAFSVVDRVVTLVMVVVNGFEQMAFLSALVPFIVVAALASYVYKSETQAIFKIKKSMPSIVAAILGVCLAAAVLGGAYAIASSAGAQADAAQGNG